MATNTSTSTPKSIYSEKAIDYLVNPLFQMQDTDETLRKLGVHRKELRALESDDEIYAAIETRREALIATAWRLEKGVAKQNKFLNGELDAILTTVLRGAFSAVLYGYSVQEAIYIKRDDGMVCIDSISEKPFEWFEPKSDGRLIYRSMMNPMGEEVDQTLKFFLTVRNETYRQPYGESLLSRIYWAWLFRVNGWKFWAKNLERAGTPFIKGTAPDYMLPDGTPAVDKLASVLNAAVQNATLALPEGWTAEFMSAQQTGASFEQFETAVIKRIQKVILGQTLTSDVGSSGSFAAAKVHAGVLEDRKRADIRLVSKTIQDIINALHAVNSFSGEPPVFIMEDNTGLEVDRAERDAKLVQAGVLKLTTDYLLRVYDFEDGDFEIPDAPLEPPLKSSGNPAPPAPSNFAASIATYTPAQQLIEDLGDSMMSGVGSPIEPKAIFAAVKAATSYTDLEDRLAVIFDKTDTKQFRTALERATFAADVMGFVNG
jgi:phage gp29-like protein